MATEAEITAYIKEAATARGIDPAYAIRVADSEGGRKEPARRGTFKTGSSWWPFQLHYGGKGTPYEYLGTTAGMGNSFTAQTGYQPGDPDAWRASVDYALDEVVRTGWGKWYGAAKIGITGRAGISPNAQPLGIDPANLPGSRGQKVLARPLEALEDMEEELTGVISQDRIAQLVQQHGQYTATKKPGTEKIDDPSTVGQALGRKIDNPDPTWVIVFADGSKVEVKGERGAEGGPTGNWLPVAGSTALKPSKPPAGAPSTGLWVDLGDGRRVRMQQGPDGQLVPATDAAGNPIVDQGGKTPPRGRTQAQEDASAASAALAIARARQVGQPTPLDPITAELRAAQTDKAQIDALVAARKLIPEQLRLIQETEATVQQIHQQIANGSISVADGQKWVEAAYLHLDAGLRGTTPAKEEELRQKAITERAQIGRDLLNEQVQSSAQLAGNLNRDYKDLLLKTLEPPGEYDPLERASLMTAGMGGALTDPGTTEIANLLIATLGGGGVSPATTGRDWAAEYPGVTPASLTGPNGETAPDEAEEEFEDELSA